MLVPDLLHEIELGVFKMVFAHLIRILYAHNAAAVVELNRRYATFHPAGRHKAYKSDCVDIAVCLHSGLDLPFAGSVMMSRT
jgi:hypothetical protein